MKTIIRSSLIFLNILPAFTTPHGVIVITFDNLQFDSKLNDMTNLKAIQSDGIYFPYVAQSSSSSVSNAASLLLGIHSAAHNSQCEDTLILE
jgi:hypothetical protein